MQTLDTKDLGETGPEPAAIPAATGRDADAVASRAEIERSDERLTFALDAGKLGSWQLDLDGKVLETSALCRHQFGHPAEAAFSYAALLGSLHPEDRERVIAAAQAAIDGRSDLEVGTRVVTPGGETRWVEIRGRATYRDGRAHEMAGVTFDITQRKLADERQNLLIRELHHRVKNTLSTVQAIVGSTARGAHSIDEFYRDFTGRIMSLANTHSILTEELWQRAPLAELLRKELEIYDDGAERVTIGGPALELPSDYAVPLGMAFHELTTNAAKYGALSNDRGRISITWTLDETPARPRVSLSWVESGGPPVATPTRQGFGTRLLDRVLAAQVKADVGIDYAPEGLRVTLSFALPDTPVGAPPRGWS